MTRAPAAGRYRHELVVTASAEDLVRHTAEVVDRGRAAGEPVLLMLSPPVAEAVLERVGGADGVTLTDPQEHRTSGAGELARVHSQLTRWWQEHAGCGRVRMVTEVPQSFPQGWWDWCRFEAAANVALAEFDAWAQCAVRRDRTGRRVLEDLLATHPLVHRNGESAVNAYFRDPAEVAAARLEALPDPVESEPPVVELVQPSPAAARAAVAGVAARVGLGSLRTDELLFATNEVVSNALTHGTPPVRLRIWTTRGFVLVAVTDQGAGVDDPFVGILPVGGRRPEDGGHGLWLAHQLLDVSHQRTEHGYTVRVRADLAQGTDGADRRRREDA